MTKILKIIILVCMTAGFFLLIRNIYERNLSQNSSTHSKSNMLKKYFINKELPQRVEIFNYTKRFENDVNKIKKIKIPQSSKSTFYVTIQFFTDESDNEAPLIAQIRFIDIKSGNQINEESLNLE